MQRHIVETLVGTLVLAIAIGFGWYAYSTTGRGSGSGSYTLNARFPTVSGLTNGTDVRIAGIKVGTVTDVSLDPKTYFPTVQISIRNDIKVPADSKAEIQTEGLLGGRYMNIVPGADDDLLASGATIRFTQPAVDFMELLSRFIFAPPAQPGKDGKAPPAGAPPTAYPGTPEAAPAQ